jgi:ABC-type lipoprotein release transport system permease subunit
VIGVSRSRRHGLLTSVSRELFQPLGPDSHPPQALLVRTRVPPRDAAAAVSAAIQSASPRLPFVNVRPLDDLADAQTRSFRLGATVFGLYGTAAIVLAVVGLYTLLAFSARRRTIEIGVRLALGASSADVFRLVLRHGATLVAAGWALGVGTALVAARPAASLLFGVEPTDGAAFAASSLLVASACLTACVLPAWRAARVDPVVALRRE